MSLQPLAPGQLNELGFPYAGEGIYLLRDEFLTDTGAPLSETVPSVPGPGTLVKSADTGNNASIANGKLSLAAVVGNADPAYYWQPQTGSGFSRVPSRALIAYAIGTPWLGWSKSTILSAANMAYGAKERSAYADGVEYSEALPIGDPMHMIILRDTGALHVCRRGLSEFLCWTYPAGADATLWPAILGSVCDYDALYCYNVTPPTPTSELITPAQGNTFTHLTGSFLFEVTFLARSASADTVFTFRKQDDQNYLALYVTAGGSVGLYKCVGGVFSSLTAMFANGSVVAGTRLVIQWDPVPNQLVGTGSNSFKAWAGSSYVCTTLSPTVTFLQASTAGIVTAKPSGTTLANLRCWPITL